MLNTKSMNQFLSQLNKCRPSLCPCCLYVCVRCQHNYWKYTRIRLLIFQSLIKFSLWDVHIILFYLHVLYRIPTIFGIGVIKSHGPFREMPVVNCVFLNQMFWWTPNPLGGGVVEATGDCPLCWQSPVTAAINTKTTAFVRNVNYPSRIDTAKMLGCSLSALYCCISSEFLKNKWRIPTRIGLLWWSVVTDGCASGFDWDASAC